MKLVRSANSELLIIFPTINTFHRQEHNGAIKILIDNVLQQPNLNSDLKVRIMTPADYRTKYTAQKLKQKYKQNINIQYIQESLENTAPILVVDRSLSLSVDVKDDSEETANDMSLGLATYSNSKSTVLSYASMFEGFWKQADIYEELRESKIRLSHTRNELDEMKQYLNEVLKEVHGKGRYSA